MLCPVTATPEPGAIDSVTLVAFLGTVKVSVFEGPPPGSGFTTATSISAGTAMSADGIVIRNWLSLSKMAERRSPFHDILEPVVPPTKPDPRMVNSNAGPPAATAEGGPREVILGTGLATMKV